MRSTTSSRPTRPLLVRLGHESLKIARDSPPMIANFAALGARRAEVIQSIPNWAQTVDDDEIASPTSS